MRISILLPMIMAFMFCSDSLLANIWRVNNNDLYTNGCEHCFSSIQDAVNSVLVSPGDTLHVEASLLDYEGADINKSLTIVGTGYFLDENLSLQQNQVSATISSDLNLVEGSEGTVLEGLRIKGAYAGIHIYVNNITISRCYSGSAGLFLCNEGLISNITIRQCFLSKLTHCSYPDPISNLLITNCFMEDVYLTESNIYEGVFAHNVVGDYIEGSNAMEYYNNIFMSEFQENNNNTSNVFNNIFMEDLPAWLSGGTNYYVPAATVFISEGSTDGLLQVNPENICPECYMGYVPGGSDNVEIGIFGGVNPYVLSGVPGIPSIYYLQGSANTYQGDTTHVFISTRSNY
jgi:hypothetical protein